MTDRLSGSTPNLEDVIREAIDSYSLRVHTALPGVIKEWDPDTQTASVLPAVQTAVRDLKGRHIFETLPLIYDVPVMFPRTLAGYMTFPIQVGDTGLLIFPELDPAQWLCSDPNAPPKSAGDQRRHDLSGAVFIPGLYQYANKITDFDSDNVVLSSTSLVKVGGASATDPVVLMSKLEAQLSILVAGINAAAVVANDGGAAFKTNLLAYLDANGFNASGATGAEKVVAE
jgi:hypothetical protein